MSVVDDAQRLAIALQKQLRSRKAFPANHVVAIAYAKVFGPKNKVTPEGHPITISSGLHTTVRAIGVEYFAILDPMTFSGLARSRDECDGVSTATSWRRSLMAAEKSSQRLGQAILTASQTATAAQITSRSYDGLC